MEADPPEELIGALQERLDGRAVRHSYNQVWRDLLDLDLDFSNLTDFPSTSTFSFDFGQSQDSMLQNALCHGVRKIGIWALLRFKFQRNELIFQRHIM